MCELTRMMRIKLNSRNLHSSMCSHRRFFKKSACGGSHVYIAFIPLVADRVKRKLGY